MIGTGGASLGKWARLVQASDTDPALTVNQQSTGAILQLQDNGVAVFTVNDGGHQTVGDDVRLGLGAGNDVVLLNRSTALAADTVLANVLVGTVESQGIAANSAMISNVTSDGDIALYVNMGNNSQMGLWLDGSSGNTAVLAASGASVDHYIAGTKVLDHASGLFAFQQATNITTTSGTLTITPLGGQAFAVVLSTTGDFSVNTTHLFVDTSSGQTGIGGAPGTSPVTARLDIVGLSGEIILCETYVSAGQIRLAYANGSRAVPTVVTSNSILYEFKAMGFDGLAWRNVASVSFEMDYGTVGAGDMPGRVVMWTTADAGSSIIARAWFDSGGNFGLGKPASWAASGFGTDAARVFGIYAGTAPTTALADMAQLWVGDINGAAGYAGFHMMVETNALPLVVVGVRIKTDTGQTANPFEGLMEINTFDNTVKIYADAGWRTLASAW